MGPVADHRYWGFKVGFEDLLRDKGPEILSRWRKMIAESYPAQTAAFLQTEEDRFRNPVGHTILHQTTALFDVLLRHENTENFAALVEPLVRIRAVQDLTPVQAVGFVFDLKRAVRQALEREIQDCAISASLLQFESRIDALALEAFDCYMDCREQIYRLRTDEVKRQTQYMLDRATRSGKRTEKIIEGSLQQ